MRVALLHFCFEDYTIELANALVEFVELSLIQPHKVTAICKGALDPRIQIYTFKKPRIRDPRNLFSMVEMMRIIRAIQPDVLHAQETNDFWYDLTLLFNTMPPLVTTIHDVFRHPGDRETAPGAEYTRLISLYKSRQLIVHTQSLREILYQKFHISKQRVNVLSHGELGSLYKRRSTDRQIDTQEEQELYTLLFFGRLWSYKGLKYLLDALPLIIKHIPDVKLIIAGRGENLNQYFPNGYNPKHVEILNDFIPIEQVTNLFQRSAATVLPYIEASQSGVAALSYGLGTPVIASNVGGLSEIVRHEQDGLLVPPGDAQALADVVVRFLSDRALQDKLQSGVLVRCQKDLNWRNIAAQTVEVYQQVSARSSPRYLSK